MNKKPISEAKKKRRRKIMKKLNIQMNISKQKHNHEELS